MVKNIRSVLSVTAVIGVVAAATVLSAATGTLLGQAQAKSASATPAPGNGSMMVQTHKRAQPQVPELERAEAEDSNFNDAQGPGPGPIGPGPGCDVFPAPANIGTKVRLSYFGPPPSTENPSLVGPEQLLKSGTVDAASGTITLPLYLGYMAGTKKNAWYILTDVDDQGVAAELGLNYSAKLTFALPVREQRSLMRTTT